MGHNQQRVNKLNMPSFSILLLPLMLAAAHFGSNGAEECAISGGGREDAIMMLGPFPPRLLLACPSLDALRRAFDGGGNASGGIQNGADAVEHLQLNCAGAEKGEKVEGLDEAFGQLRTKFPALRQLSIHNCSPTAAISVAHFGANVPLDSLNLSGNGLREFGWQHLLASDHHQLVGVELLDLRQNPLDCGECANAWMGAPPSGTAERQRQREEDGQQIWPIRTLFPSIPGRTLSSARNCSFDHCPRESAKFEGKPPAELQLGARLELKCRFGTDNPLPANTSAAMPIFLWPLNEPGAAEDGQNSTKGFQTILLPRENAALLRVDHLQSDHLGAVACRCLHCAVPTFDMVQLRFPVPLSVHIPPGQPPGDRHMILHGFPLAGPIQMDILWVEANRSETHKFGGEHVTDESEPRAQLFFDGSLAVRPEPGHSQFFLRYFSLSIHECAHCAHSQSGGTFRFQICTGGEAGNCAEISQKMEPPAHSISAKKDFHPLVDSSSSSASFSFLHFLISIPPILLSVALLSIGARTIWRFKQRMAIREKLKRKSRRASRNTQRTEETSIPLDTMSRSLSLSNYIQSQLHVPLIESRELQLNERIGKGAFGEVYVAVWRRARSEEGEPMLMENGAECGDGGGGGPGGERRVAIKMLTSVQMDAEMDREAALLARLEHPNVLRMFGISHWSGQIALVLELMNLGDLRNYLRNREPRCNNYAQFPPALLPTELVDICIQICEGLCYLAQQQIVHRDLAARNCLVSGESDMRSCSAAFRPPISIKISDFGMSRRLYASAEYYRMADKKTALPVRWMPPECLSSGKFTPQSDIWSFGVLLFEIFTFGGMPFAALSNGEVLTAVLGGMRPEVPQRCQPPELADLMRACWHRNPQKRQSALEALQRLRQIQERGPGGGGSGDGQAATTALDGKK